MTSVFHVIYDDFIADLQSIVDLVNIVEQAGGSAKSRVASVNSATLLVSATFEEFIRETARQCAREVIGRTQNVDALPRKLAQTAWKRTLEELARAKIDTGGTPLPLAQIAAAARASFDSLCKFIEGDTSQDIYKYLAHNENNMRPDQINAIFKVSDLGNICLKIAEMNSLHVYFGSTDAGSVHGKLTQYLNDFMEKRNSIAHNLNPGSSSSVDIFIRDVEFLKSFASSLADYLKLRFT